MRSLSLPDEVSFYSPKMVTGGSIKMYGGDVPIFVGSWLDIFDWIMSNWPAIMEMIMQIISMFNAKKISAEVAVLLIVGLLRYAMTQA